VTSTTVVDVPQTTDSTSAQSEFVFGSNLADRVVMATPGTTSAAASLQTDRAVDDIMTRDDKTTLDSTSQLHHDSCELKVMAIFYPDLKHTILTLHFITISSVSCII